MRLDFLNHWATRFFPLVSRRQRRKLREPRVRRVQPKFEVLEDRTVPATALGLTFDTGAGPLKEIPLQSYSWGVGSGPDVGEFSLSLAGGEIEPGLWGHAATGDPIPSATIHVRNPAGVEYITYTLDNVVVSSFSTSQDQGGAAPRDSVSLGFTKVTETFREIEPDGKLGVANSASYDLAQAKTDQVGNAAYGASTAVAPQLGLTLVENGVSLPEKDITSYSWGAEAGGMSADFSDLVIDLDGNVAEPALWGHLVGEDKSFDSATIHVRDTDGNEYRTFELTDVTITSFSTGAASGNVPSDSFALHFEQFAETAYSIAPDGKLGDSNKAKYDLKEAKVEKGSLDFGESTAVRPRLGLTLDVAGRTIAEKDILDYKWGITATDEVGPPNFSTMDLTLLSTAADPGFWSYLAAGTPLDGAVVHVRNADGVEFITFTLTDVLISNFSTSQSRGGVAVNSISLAFGTFAQASREIDADGTPGSLNTAGYDLAQAKFTDASFDLTPGASTALAPQLSLSFQKGDTVYPEKDITSYSWGAGSTGMAADFSDFSLTLPGTAADPALWGYLVRQDVPDSAPFDSVTLHVRNARGDEYLTYTLTNAVITSYGTEAERGGMPSDRLTLRYDAIAESFHPIDGKGNVESPNTAKYDLKQAKVDDAGSLSFGDSTSLRPRIGVTLIEDGVSFAEKDVQSYAWGVENTDEHPFFSDVVLSLQGTAIEPALWARMAAGARLDKAIVHVRNADGEEYATYTLTDVLISSFSTSAARGGPPTDSLSLSFAKFGESFKAIEPDGTTGPANTAEYDLTKVEQGLDGTNRLDVGASNALHPQLGLTFIDDDNELPEKDVLSYSWDIVRVGHNVGAGDFKIVVPANDAEPGFWGHVAVPVHFDKVLIHARDAQGREYATYTLEDAYISSFSTGLSVGGIPVDALKLSFAKISEDWYAIDEKGRVALANSASFGVASGVSEGTGNLGSFATATALSVSTTAAVYGEPVTFTATVSADGAIPAGTVTFFDGMTDLSGPIDLATAGTLQQASFTISSLGVGPHSITAVFNENAAFLGSTSSSAALTVSPGATTTTVASTNPSSVYGDSVTFTATVSPAAPSTVAPTGTVRFIIDATPVSGPISLSTVGGQRQASFTINSLGAGTHVITAVYEDPSGNYAGSIATASQAVAKATLFVTADDKTRIQGEANPAFTASYSGFVLGQDPSVLGGTLTFTTAASASSPPGTYAIVPGGLTSDNYDIKFISGTLTVLSFADAAGNLVDQVNAAGLSGGRNNALVASLQAAIDSFDRGNTTAGVNQLQAFENKVRAQRGKSIDPALADVLLAAAERIIAAVQSSLELSHPPGRRGRV